MAVDTKIRATRNHRRGAVTLVHAAPESKARAKRAWRPRSQAAGRVEDRMVELLDMAAARGRELAEEDVSYGGALWR